MKLVFETEVKGEPDRDGFEIGVCSAAPVGDPGGPGGVDATGKVGAVGAVDAVDVALARAAASTAGKTPERRTAIPP
ncbi:MAG TPA: hypothetical protein VKO16_08395, partial [Polyangia bacterium]|nr:hypothetical protein [Polyangia bacterium]